jgi:cytoskeletal protein CcmA (bactofilin family)
MMWRRGEQADPSGEITDVPRSDREDGRMAQVNNEVTVVGPGARLEGTVVSAGSLRIDGTVKGKINADGDVILSPQSQVEADIRAENVSVAGRFVGNITVKGRTELARGGRIDGDVTSKILVVQEGGVFCGQSIMDQQAQKSQQPEAGQGATRPDSQAGREGSPTVEAPAPKVARVP